MKKIPTTIETRLLARKLVWFEAAEMALSDPIRFLAYAFALATHDEMQLLRRYLDDDDLREALDHAPPGIIDRHSWSYWNLRLGRYLPPPMKQRFTGWRGPVSP